MSDTASKTQPQNLVGLPRFSNPDPTPLHSLNQGPFPTQLPQDQTPTLSLAPDGNGHGAGSTHTVTSATRVPTAKEQANTAKLVEGVVKLAIVFVGLGLARFAARRLRKPTPEQLTDFTTPIGAVLARRIDVAKYGQDVYDLTQAGGALSDWISDGPITEPVRRVEHIGLEKTDPTGAAAEYVQLEEANHAHEDQAAEPVRVQYLP